LARWTPLARSGTVVSLGLWGGLGHYFTARAYHCAPASVVAPFSYLQLVGAAVGGYLAFAEVPGAAPRLVSSRRRVVQTWPAAGSGLMLGP